GLLADGCLGCRRCGGAATGRGRRGIQVAPGHLHALPAGGAEAAQPGAVRLLPEPDARAGGLMDIEEFAAARGARLAAADEELRPLVTAALTRFDDAGWEDLADAASVLWLEMFEDAAPRAYQEAALANFRRELIAALKKTASPDDPPAEYQIE